MKTDAFLAKLEKVRRTGNGTWIACCPGHDDRSPSMTVREADGGVVLVHCFAGCDVGKILGAVGMDFDALFPDKPQADRVPAVRRPFPAADVLEAVAGECLLISVAAANISRGLKLTDEDRARVMTASERVLEARRLALG